MSRRTEQLDAENNERQAARVVTGGGGPHDPGMEGRIAALENAVTDMRITLGRIEERTGLLATKEDVSSVRVEVAGVRGEVAEVRGEITGVRGEIAGVRGEIAGVRGEVAAKATRGTVWGMGFTVAGIVIAALAAGAIYMPYVATLLRRAGQ